jgi:L-fuculose-phosphate aldolase
MRTEYNLRKDLVEVCKRMYQKGFIAASDGNVSIRINENRILFTPSGVCKGFIEPEDLIVTDLQGRIVSGKGKPTTEINMHIAAYQQRNDITAVVHGHPPITIAFGYAGINLSECLLPEVIVTLGTLPTAPYELTGTQKLADSLKPFLLFNDAVILNKHGLITIGCDVFDAYYKLEKVEHNAQVVSIARQLGKLQPLSEDQIQELLILRKKIHC